MAVLNFAAHHMDYEIVTNGYTDEETGDYIKGKSEWHDGYDCDVVPAGKANTLSIPDGSLHPYSYTVYNLPKNCREFHYGDKIRIHFYKGDEVREFLVLGFHRYQLQSKIWI